MGKHIEKIHENVIKIQETSQSPSIIQIRGIQIVNSPLKLLPWQGGCWMMGSWLVRWSVQSTKTLNSEVSKNSTWICLFGARTKTHNILPEMAGFSHGIMTPMVESIKNITFPKQTKGQIII